MSIFRCRSFLGRLLSVAVCAATPVFADDVAPNGSAPRWYGHFTPSILYVDDGVSAEANLVDNAHSGGRIGVWWDDFLGNEALRFNGEVSLGLRSSSSLSQGYRPDVIDIGSHSLRKFEVIYATPRFGKFSVGQGSMGSDGVTEADLSGTTLATHVGLADTAGGYLFRTASGSISTIRIKDAFPSFDGGRSRRVRYDSPYVDFSYFGRLRFSASLGVEDIDRTETLNDALSDAGLFYQNRLAGFVFAGSAGVSIAEVPGASNAPQVAGSFSALHEDTGLNLTGATGSRDNGGSYVYAKAGIRRDWFGIGKTSFSLDWYEGIDTAGAGYGSSSFGMGIVQKLDKQNLEVFLGYRKYGLRNSGIVSHRDMTSVMFGLRWKFRKLENRKGIFEGLWQG